MRNLIEKCLLGLEEHEDSLEVDTNEPETPVEIEESVTKQITESITGDNELTDPTLDPEDIPLHSQLEQGSPSEDFKTEHEREFAETDELEELQTSQAALEEYLSMISNAGPKGISETSLVALGNGLDFISAKHGLTKSNLGLEDFVANAKSNLVKVKVDSGEITNLLSQIETKIEKVSTEGIGSVFGDIFRNITKGRRPDVKDSDTLANILDKLKSTYGNKSWLAGRRLIEGEVTFKTTVMLDNNYEAFIKKVMNDTVKAAKGYNGDFDKALIKIKPWMDYLDNKTYKTKPELASELRSSVPRFNGDGISITFYSLVDTVNSKDLTLPALNAEQITKLVKLIIEYIDAYREIWTVVVGDKWMKSFNFRYNGFVHGMYALTEVGRKRNYSPLVNSILAETDGKLANHCLNLSHEINTYCYEGEIKAIQGLGPFYHDLRDILKSAIRWINASVR